MVSEAEELEKIHTLPTEDDAPPLPRLERPFSMAQLLVEAGILSREHAAQALEAARREKLSLGRILGRDGLILPRDLAALMAVYLGLTMTDLGSQSLDPDALALLPEEIARRCLVLPMKLEDGCLTLAMVDPTDLGLIEDLTARTGCTIEPVIATPEDILEHIDVSYRLTENSPDAPFGSDDSHRGFTNLSLVRNLAPANVIDLLLRQAVQDRASDIHIEPAELRLRVRFRIDGILHDIMDLPLEMHPTLVSRLKIMSGMNIAERRRPQDGQFTAEVQTRKIDVRVAISSTITGEMAVLRILDKQFTLLGLDQLGMGEEVLDQYRRLLRIPYGMLVVCGPTGSGKSTTLYASLLNMNRTESNIISLEDPVEYRVTDANQMQIHNEAGITFATLLRSVLRLDPDVILVGEIRDRETAVIATQAALTGHVVLTSLHANDSISALLRLRDLGVASYLIGASVAGIVSQRMCRVVCDGCKALVPRPLPEQQAYASEMSENRDHFIYGSGCNLCAQTGYRGRAGVFEVLTMTDVLRRLFLESAPRDQIWEEATASGMVPIRRAGMLKVKHGITTPYEVMRVLFSLE